MINNQTDNQSAGLIKVIAFGTFDYFHPGHHYFLTQARLLGDELLVVVARDLNVFKLKGAYPVHSEDRRLAMIKEANIADRVILGDLFDKMKVLHDYRPEIIALGFDQQASIENILSVLPAIKIIRLSAHFPQKYKSSIIKKLNSSL